MRLSWLSVAWAVISGAASVAIGLVDHSTAVAGLGLNLLADLVGSAALIWRFERERRAPHHAASAEGMAQMAVGVGLLAVAAYLSLQSIRQLMSGRGAIATLVPALVAAASIAVLPPLAIAKRRTGAKLGSAALRGDGTLSAVGAAGAAVALTGVVASGRLGWWWADPAAALIVAAVAAVEARAVLATAHRGTDQLTLD